ncbi:hypothetical protein GCM10009539_73770 [Cryptosporangium japonicum]|uniref:Uncharacterized protein n=1 Tax=Cryptosporangium japonicum TaxID=80872 RepID=A0ABP3ERG0_9ACTN
MRGAHLGDAIGHVLSTATGAVWVGYFDEAAAHGSGLGGHGLVRFDAELTPEWLYPFGTGLPTIWDCYGLNVAGEQAWANIYNHPNRLISVDAEQASDHGADPVNGADRLLIDGTRGALIGGRAGEHDLVTPILLTPEGVAKRAGAPSRLVMPDGTELPRARRDARPTCRGPEMHVLVGSAVYRVDLDDLTPA